MGLKTKLQRRRWVSYKIGSLMAREAGCRSRAQYWRWWEKTKPVGLSKFPFRVYPEWRGWNAFLGTSNTMDLRYAENRKFWSYPEAMKWTHAQGWKSERAFDRARREGKLPQEMPRYPQNFYKNAGWVGWPIFLGKSAQAVVEAAKINTAILAISIPRDLPGGYISVAIKDTPTIMKEYITSEGLRPIKMYQWEPDKKPILQNILARNGSPKAQNIWLVSNVNQIVADLDQLLLWFRFH